MFSLNWVAVVKARSICVYFADNGGSDRGGYGGGFRWAFFIWQFYCKFWLAVIQRPSPIANMSWEWNPTNDHLNHLIIISLVLHNHCHHVCIFTMDHCAALWPLPVLDCQRVDNGLASADTWAWWTRCYKEVFSSLTLALCLRGCPTSVAVHVLTQLEPDMQCDWWRCAAVA